MNIDLSVTELEDLIYALDQAEQAVRNGSNTDYASKTAHGNRLYAIATKLRAAKKAAKADE